jgi:enoyl-CoA hydratase
MSEPVLLVEKDDGVATLTLNRPDQMNALSLELRQALHQELEAIRTDKSIYVVILTGAGRGFCAGLDLKEMGGEKGTSGGPQPPDPPSLLRALPQPVIGAINGVAVTGGLEISLSCDVLVGTPATRFADTHARVGLIAGWGLGARLSHVIGPLRAKEMSLTGNFLSAEKAYEWGLLNRIVPPEELLPTCHGLARDMLSTVPEAMLEYYHQIDKAFDLSLGDAMRYETDIARRHRSPRPDVVASRRGGIQERGREQQKG